MQRTHGRLLIAAALLTVVAVGAFSAIGIFARNATPTPAPGHTTKSTSRSAASPGTSPGPVIALVDIAFQPKTFALPANTPTVITVINRGAVVHTFTIDALNIHSGDLAPGQTTTVTIDAPAGSYTYYCAIPGHRQAGMVGTLIIT